MPVMSAVGIVVCLETDVHEKGEREAPLVLACADHVCHATAAPRGARLILPALRHPVQTFTLMVLPSGPTMRATCRFGLQVRRVLLFACETLLPNATPFLQT